MKEVTLQTVAATDYMKAYADQIRNWVKAPYVVLGTDGFGRSGTREELRRFFEVDRYHIVYNTLAALAREGELDASKMAGYAKQLGINCDLPDPVTV